jgi:hypothetical protein
MQEHYKSFKGHRAEHHKPVKFVFVRQTQILKPITIHQLIITLRKMVTIFKNFNEVVEHKSIPVILMKSAPVAKLRHHLLA